ncbi:MAG: hypothetical protein HC788_08065 [Sphingopyxis sp.]|nr:hypothetical protein [Sphingopyxis sp.]
MKTEQRIGLPQIGIDRQRPFHAVRHQRRLRRTIKAGRVNGNQLMNFALEQPRFGKIGIDCDRLFQQLDRGVERAIAEHFETERLTRQIEVISIFAVRHVPDKGRRNDKVQRVGQRLRYRLRHILLQQEDAVQRAIVTLAPAFKAACTIDKVHMNAHPLALPLHRPFDQVRHPQGRRNLGQRLGRIAEMKGRCPPRHQQLRHLAQCRDHFIDDAVGK